MGSRAHVFALVGSLGFGMLVYLLLGIASAPWGLDANSPTTMSVESSDAGCDWQSGAQYEIDVEGQHYKGCAGGVNKCAFGDPVEIAYDPSDPAQCRVAANVDGLSRYEISTSLIALTMSIIGFAGIAYLWSARVRVKAIANGATELPTAFTRLQLISWLCLALGVVTINATAIYALL